MAGAYGYCKICAWRHAKEFNRRVKQGWNSAQMVEWSQSKSPALSFDRKTFYAHKKHSMHPADALISYQERAVEVAVTNVTTDEALDAIKNIGLANVMADPGQINPAHTLKAIELIERKRESSSGAQLLDVMVKAMLGARVEQLVVIEGTAVEETV